jgi:hypothetical protein
MYRSWAARAPQYPPTMVALALGLAPGALLAW